MHRLAAALALTLAACTPTPLHHWQDAPAEVQAEHSPGVIQDYIDAYWRNVWVETYWRRVVEFARAVERAQQQYQPGQCGGDLPPCWVMMRESGGDIRAKNPHSTASGKWQFINSTWARHRGYLRAMDAPEWVQDEKARQVWDHGRGCSHWSAC